MAEQKNVSNTRETIALVISGAIVLASIVYWILQIQGVIEILKLAAGG